MTSSVVLGRGRDRGLEELLAQLKALTFRCEDGDEEDGFVFCFRIILRSRQRRHHSVRTAADRTSSSELLR